MSDGWVGGKGAGSGDGSTRLQQGVVEERSFWANRDLNGASSVGRFCDGWAAVDYAWISVRIENRTAGFLVARVCFGGDRQGQPGSTLDWNRGRSWWSLNWKSGATGSGRLSGMEERVARRLVRVSRRRQWFGLV